MCYPLGPGARGARSAAFRCALYSYTLGRTRRQARAAIPDKAVPTQRLNIYSWKVLIVLLLIDYRFSVP
jgi:hypothetical protein